MLLSLFSTNERERVFIDNSSREVVLFMYDLPHLIDSTGTLKFEDILNSQKQFSVQPNYKPKDFCANCTYWIKVPLLVGNELEDEWMLEFFDQTIDNITGYFPTRTGSYQVEEVGDYYKFRNKDFAHKNFQWILDTELTGQQNVYFKIKSHTYADVRIVIRTVNRFVEYAPDGVLFIWYLLRNDLRDLPVQYPHLLCHQGAEIPFLYLLHSECGRLCHVCRWHGFSIYLAQLA